MKIIKRLAVIITVGIGLTYAGTTCWSCSGLPPENKTDSSKTKKPDTTKASFSPILPFDVTQITDETLSPRQFQVGFVCLSWECFSG